VAAAAADLAEVEVFRRPNIAVLGTGDELADPGKAKHRPGSIPESVTFGVAAIVQEHGGRRIYRGRVGDDLAQTEVAARDALKLADLLVLTGGASVGEKDFAKSAFDSIGLELFFSKVAMKPGKPVWFGRAGGRLVMGLPGNPTSALVTARLLLAPLIAGMSGRGSALEWRQAPLAEPLPATGDRETFVRARWKGPLVVPVTNQDSGAQRALAEAELLIRRPSGCAPISAGELVYVIDF
jgi:molybdopterin molybdotransferase